MHALLDPPRIHQVGIVIPMMREEIAGCVCRAYEPQMLKYAPELLPQRT